MANDVKLKVGADTGDLEKEFGALVKKVQSQLDKLKLGPESSKATPAATKKAEAVSAAKKVEERSRAEPGSMRETVQISKSLDAKVAQEKKGLDQINGELVKKKALIDDLTKQQATLAKGSEKELEIQKQIGKEKEKYARAQGYAQIRQVGFDRAQAAADKIKGLVRTQETDEEGKSIEKVTFESPKASEKGKEKGSSDKVKVSTPGVPGALQFGTAVNTQRRPAGQEGFEKVFKTVVAQKQKTKEDVAALKIANSTLSQKDGTLNKIKKQEDTLLKMDKDATFWTEQRKKYEEEINSILETREALQKKLKVDSDGNPVPDAADKPKEKKGKEEDVVGQLMSKLSVAGVISGITGVVVQGINQIVGSPSRALAAGGSAVANTVGKEYASVYNGNLPTELALTKEKAEAKRMADTQEKGERAKDKALTVAAATGVIATGGLALSGVGAIPAIGTAVGAGAAAFGTQRMRAKTVAGLTKDFFPEYSKQQTAEYESLIAQQNSEDFNKNYESKKKLNPTKVLAAEEYNQNAQRDVDFQRQMGLSNEEFRGRFESPTGNAVGGFKQKAFDAGFTSEQAMQSASNIQAAGGSTRASTGLATTALQAGRNLDLTNASSVIGKLSGSLGGSDTTKEAFVKILAEGTKVGLDGSEYRSENRRFIETAAEVISQSGTTSTAGVEQILGQFGRFFGDKTMAGQDAGKSAYEMYRQTSMAQTGPEGTMRAAGMLTDPTIAKLDTFSRASLFNMPIDQLTPDNPAIISMAKKAGVKPEELIEAQNNITAKSANKFEASDTAVQKLKDVKEKYGVKSAIGFQGPLAPKAYDEMTEALGQSNTMQGLEHPNLAQNQRAASAYSDALSSGDTKKMSKAMEEAKTSQLEKPSSGRAEDETNKIRAEMSREVNRIFVDMKDSIIPAAGAAENFVRRIKELNAAMMALPENQRAGFANANILPIFGHAPETAASAGPPTAGSPPNGR